MSNITQLPVIAGHEITTDKYGRFNLNAIWRAAGSPEHKRPNQWVRLSETQELIKEAKSQTVNMQSEPLVTINGGRHSGTFSIDELAVSYAGWISARFQLQVNRVFIQHQTNKAKWRQSRNKLAFDTHGLTDALLLTRKGQGKETKAHVYMNEHRLINSVVMGEYKGIDRDILTDEQCRLMDELVLHDILLVGWGLTFQERKARLAEYRDALMPKLGRAS